MTGSREYVHDRFFLEGVVLNVIQVIRGSDANNEHDEAQCGTDDSASVLRFNARGESLNRVTCKNQRGQGENNQRRAADPRASQQRRGTGGLCGKLCADGKGVERNRHDPRPAKNELQIFAISLCGSAEEQADLRDCVQHSGEAENLQKADGDGLGGWGVEWLRHGSRGYFHRSGSFWSR